DREGQAPAEPSYSVEPGSAGAWPHLLPHSRGRAGVSLWHGFSSRGRRRIQDSTRVRRGNTTSSREEQALLLLKHPNASAARVGVSTQDPSPGKELPTHGS